MSDRTTYKEFATLSAPIILSNILVPIVGMVDIAVIGQMGDTSSLAAVNLGAQQISLLLWVFNFLAMTTTAEISKSFIKDDQEAIDQQIAKATILILFLSMGIFALSPLIIWGFPIMSAASEEVSRELRYYLIIRGASLPFALFSYVATGYFLGKGRSKTILYIKIILQLSNLILDILFVVGFHLSVIGVALASLLAEILAMGMALYLMRHVIVRIITKGLLRWHIIKGQGVWMQNNIYIFARSLALQTMIFLFYRESAKLGDLTLAVNGILMQFIYLCAYAADGFAASLEVITGRAIGRNDKRRLRNDAKRGVWLCILTGIFFAQLIYFFGGSFLHIFSSDEALISMAKEFLPFISFAVIFGSLAWGMDGIFFGANMGFDIFIAMLSSLILVAVLIYIFVPIYGNNALWGIWLAGFTFRGLGLIIAFPRVEKICVAE